MRTRNTFGILIVVIGVALLVLGAVAIYATVVASNTPPLAPQLLTSPVLVAASDLPLGHALTEADVRTISLPLDVVPRGAFSDPTEVVGRIVKENLGIDEIILEINLADPTNVAGDLGFILANDHVLMAFPATDRISNLDLVKTGDLIDILASLSIELVHNNPATEVDETVVELITFDAKQAQPITALVANISENAPSGNKSYLLALAPQDALILKNLIDQGAIFDIVLRNPGSQLNFRLDPVSLEYLRELYGLGVILP